MKMDKGTLGVLAIMATTAVVAIVSGDTPHFEGGNQCFIGGLISGALSAIGGLTSGLVANAQAKKAKAEQDKAEGKLKDWYNAEIATDILDRADTMSMLNAYRETMAEQNRKYANNAIKGGASEEAQVAYAQAANKGYADAISKISAQGQQRKDQVTDAYMQGMMNIHNKRAEDYMNAGRQMSSAISGAFGGLSDALGGVKLPNKK
jgi:hypothetical protein